MVERMRRAFLGSSRRGTRSGTDTLVSLRYPKGRVHEAVVTRTRALRPGDRFDLYGRNWTAVEVIKLPRGREHVPERMLCVSTAGLVTPER